jgi:hypothetical protein
MGVEIILPASGVVARVATTKSRHNLLYDGVPIYTPRIQTGVTGLPETPFAGVDPHVCPICGGCIYEEDSGYYDRKCQGHDLLIVSSIVSVYCRSVNHPLLPWLVSPGTGPDDEPWRGSDGQIRAVTRLVAA